MVSLRVPGSSTSYIAGGCAEEELGPLCQARSAIVNPNTPASANPGHKTRAHKAQPKIPAPIPRVASETSKGGTVRSIRSKRIASARTASPAKAIMTPIASHSRRAGR